MPTLLITGANRGLGLEFVRQYAGDTWNVIAACREPSKANELQALAKANPSIRIEQLDVANDASVAALAAKLNDVSIDLLINNAGIYSGATREGVDSDDDSQSFGVVDADAWAKVLRINTIAPIMVTQAFAPHVAKSQQKKIVNITSRMGSIGETSGGYLAYRSSKAALNAAMRSILNDLTQQGIATLNLHPGWVQTDMGGTSAPLKPADSIAGMRRVIDALELKNSGQFLSYDGKTIQW